MLTDPFKVKKLLQIWSPTQIPSSPTNQYSQRHRLQPHLKTPHPKNLLIVPIIKLKQLKPQQTQIEIHNQMHQTMLLSSSLQSKCNSMDLPSPSMPNPTDPQIPSMAPQICSHLLKTPHLLQTQWDKG